MARVKATYGKKIKSRVISQRFAVVLQATSAITKNRDKPITDSNETHIATSTVVGPWKIDICLRVLCIITKIIVKITVADRNSINSCKTKIDLSILDTPFF